MSKQKSIVERIVALLQLTDSGRIQHFFDKQIKNLQREIAALERNITTLTFHHEADLDASKEKLEDAKAELESAYLNVTIDQVDNNAKQDAYSSVYWANVERAEEKVQQLEKSIESKIDAFKDQIKDIEVQIAERKRRVEKIS
jgi:prefoldin subunit 5